jgi:hypothetical protein
VLASASSPAGRRGLPSGCTFRQRERAPHADARGAREARSVVVGYGTDVGMRVRMLAIVQRMRFAWFGENVSMQKSSL